MDGNVMDFHILTSIGAGLFALSFISGMAGRLGHSIWMAVLSAVAGILVALDTGVLARPGLQPMVVIGASLVLPLLAVLVSRKFYLTEQHGH